MAVHTLEEVHPVTTDGATIYEIKHVLTFDDSREIYRFEVHTLRDGRQYNIESHMLLGDAVKDVVTRLQENVGK